MEVHTSIPPNQISELNRQLQNKEAELIQKEAALENKPNPLQSHFLAAGGIIFILLALNFYLDYRHRKNSRNGP